MKTHQLDDQQHATVIAALRFYQSKFQTVSRDRDSWIEELATNAGTVEALSDEGVDNLVESLQFEGADLSAFKTDLDAKLAAMTDEEIVASLAEAGVSVTIRRQPPPMTGIQKQCWDNMAAQFPGIEEIDEAFLKAVDEVVACDRGACVLTGAPGEDPEDCNTHGHEDDDEDFDDDNECSCCGDPTDDGEGYDGLCGNCADVAVEAMSRRGMAANPKPTNPDAPNQPA